MSAMNHMNCLHAAQTLWLQHIHVCRPQMSISTSISGYIWPFSHQILIKLNMCFTARYQRQAWSEAGSSTGLREHQHERYQVTADVCGDCWTSRAVKAFDSICSVTCNYWSLKSVLKRVSILTSRYCFKSSMLEYRYPVYNRNNKSISQSDTVCRCTVHRCFSKKEKVAIVIAMNLYLRIWTIRIF